MLAKKSRFLLVFLLVSSASSWAMEDEIDFFNVGQGHAVLINKHGQYQLTGESYVPLLIDAGSSSLPYTHQEQYVWEENQRNSFVSRIASRILKFWKASTNDNLQGGNYKLNIIVTHGDDDHGNLVPLILKKLEEEKARWTFSFTPTLLLGGEQRHYLKKDGRKKIGSFLDLLKEANINQEYGKGFSVDCQGMYPQGNLGFLDTSGCITHLYCPRGAGRDKDENTWSIITRVQINGISAIITGDADSALKRNMLASLRGQEAGLESDILMLPHHGAEGTFQQSWDEKVNPQAIVVGSAPHGGRLEGLDNGYRHPRGETILESLRLFQGRGRIWNKVRPHAIEYYSTEALHEEINAVFRAHDNYLFERVPNGALIELEQQPHSRWHLIWTDAPIYTLWTTGSLLFSRGVTTPQFIDAPNGLTGYIALTKPEFYLSPDQRPENVALTTLIGYLLQGGEGNPDILKNTITSFPVERIQNTEREGILLTQDLTLNTNRAKILKALWEILPEQRNEILSQFRLLTRHATKDHSVMYRIFKYLARMEDRENYLNYLNENAILVPDDVLKTAKALKIFSGLSLEEAREIIGSFYPIYDDFQNLSSRVHTNLLGMIEALANSIRERRISIFNAVRPVLTPYERHENPNMKFHDVNDNANLIKIYSSEPEPTLPLFKQRFEGMVSYLSADGDAYLYPENKHYFIKTFMVFPAQYHLDCLGDVLPIIGPISAAGCISYEIPMIFEKLVNIYNQPDNINYRLRLEYLTRQVSNLAPRGEEGFNSFVQPFGMWVKFSERYAQKRTTATK